MKLRVLDAVMGGIPIARPMVQINYFIHRYVSVALGPFRVQCYHDTTVRNMRSSGSLSCLRSKSSPNHVWLVVNTQRRMAK